MKDYGIAVGRVFLLATLLALLWPGLATADVLRIATWNIYFLYDEIDDVDVFPPNRIPRKEADFRNLASVMAQVDADIWALQEVESIEALERLTKHLPGRYTVAISNRRARSQKTAVLIRNRPNLEINRQGTMVGKYSHKLVALIVADVGMVSL